jgi:hypothetical protein
VQTKVQTLIVGLLAVGAFGFILVRGVGARSAPPQLEAISSDYLARPLPNGTDPTAYSHDCNAALAIASRGHNTAAVERARRMAEKLVEMSDWDHTGVYGWIFDPQRFDNYDCGQPGAMRTYHNTTCNPRGTRYMWQTGNALVCLAKAAIATGDKRYSKAAELAVKSSWNTGIRPSDCPNCFFYWYSYAPNDRGRYVRNSNALMGAGIAWLWVATGDDRYRQRALQVANAEKREFRAGNQGYYGIDDVEYRDNPADRADYIDNHVSTVVKMDYDLAVLLNRPDLMLDVVKLWSRWNTCDNKRCLSKPCLYTGAAPSCQSSYTFTPCILAKQSPAAAACCNTALEYAEGYKKRLSTFAIWHVFDVVRAPR